MQQIDRFVENRVADHLRPTWRRWVAATWTAAMPRGNNLTDAAFQRRHRWIVSLLGLQIALTIPYAVVVGRPIAEVGFLVALPVVLMVAAQRGRTRTSRSVLVTLGLFLSASEFVYLAGGAMEAHLTYFVLVGVISLYQDWRSFVVGISLVVFNHLGYAMLMPEAVFASPHGVDMSTATILRLAAIHTAFLLASTVASVVAWKASEVQAFTDVLTGLPNRKRLTAQLDRAITLASAPELCVLYLDLCGFKKVNDVYGHDAGDKLLMEISQRLRLVFRPDDVIARVGGDEFVMVMPATNLRGGVRAARRVAAACALPIAVDDRNVRVTASVGVVVVGSADRCKASEVLRDADLAMYRSKTRFGDAGGYAVFSEDMRDEARAEFELELDLATCVENKELFVMFQPIVDMVSSRIVGAEALVRWQHPTKGLIGPDVFVPLAERCGAIVRIGRWVLEAATQQMSQWHQMVPESRDVTMHVNISTHQLRDSSLVRSVGRLLDNIEMPASRLVLEVTESALLGGERDLQVLRDLKALGVRLALDDFGTGYSSLSHLAHLPVDNLKIDKSFTDDVPFGPNRTLMAGVLALAGQVGMTPVVEGIEAQEQVRELLAMGARYGQGFFFSRPISSEAFVEQLRLQSLERSLTA